MVNGFIQIFIFVVLGYLFAGLLLFLFQEKLLFHPKIVPADYVYLFRHRYTAQKIMLNADTSLDLVRFFPGDQRSVKGAVIYFHGNRKNIAHYEPFAGELLSYGYEVWMMDYPGFGRSRGRITEPVLYQEAEAVYRLVRDHFTPDRIILYGRSLGSGIASQLASKEACSRLILESPYFSLVSLVRHYFILYPVTTTLRFKIPTNEYIKNITAPITVFHGAADRVVPLSNSIKLKMLLKQEDEFIVITGGHHNDLKNFSQMKQKLAAILGD